jgi:hypothetical protein
MFHPNYDAGHAAIYNLMGQSSCNHLVFHQFFCFDLLLMTPIVLNP